MSGSGGSLRDPDVVRDDLDSTFLGTNTRNIIRVGVAVSAPDGVQHSDGVILIWECKWGLMPLRGPNVVRANLVCWWSH
jgi:hypothetical protein